MIVLDNLTLGYHRHPAVHHLNGCFKQGSLTAVVGPNGAGKSTLLKGIVGLIPVLGGQIRFVECTRRDVAYAPQLPDMDMNFPLSVLDVVALSCWSEAGAFGRVGRKIQDQARLALKQVGLSGFEDRSLDSLSVGQRQRVVFARVIMADAQVILLDEPFAAVDANTTQVLLDVIKTWQIMGRTVVAVVHDFEQTRTYFPQTLMLARKALAWGPTAQVLVPENIEAMQAMAQGWDETAPECQQAEP